MSNFTVSWVILTYNRFETVQKAITHCMGNAGEKWDEIVWCDNGSTDGVRSFMQSLNPDTAILNRSNMGAAKGYNRAMGLTTCDYLVITGCDMLMPDGWLKTFKNYVRNVPHTGVACIYSEPLQAVPERKRKAVRGEWNHEVINGLPIVHAMPIGRSIISRSLLSEIGYFPEDFGLYGWDDVAWAERAEKVCDAMGLLYYVIPEHIAEHLGSEGIKQHDGKDEISYHEFKMREALDSAKQVAMDRRREAGWPRFSPFP